MKRLSLLTALLTLLMAPGFAAPDQSSGMKEPAMKSTPSKIKVAAIRVVWGNQEPAEEVIARGMKLAEEAATAGAKYILLPEDFLRGGHPSTAAIPDGEKVKMVVDFAHRHEVCVVAGIDEFEKGANRERPETWEKFISAVFVTPEGVQSTHRKVNINIEHMAPGWKEGVPRTDGNAWPGFDYKMHALGQIKRAGIMICRDSFTNYAWTRVLSQDPQIILHPNNRNSITIYGPDLPAMAKKYAVPIIAADGHPESESMIVDRDGTILEFEKEKQRALVAEVTLADEHPNYVQFEMIRNPHQSY